jgi:hypothetical protein
VWGQCERETASQPDRHGIGEHPVSLALLWGACLLSVLLSLALNLERSRGRSTPLTRGERHTVAVSQLNLPTHGAATVSLRTAEAQR